MNLKNQATKSMEESRIAHSIGTALDRFIKINQEQMSIIFNALADLDIKINVMQNSAISFSFCIDFRESKLNHLLDRLQQYFEVYYNTGLTLITVKNYDAETFDTYRKKPGILIEQSSRSTLQVLLKL